MLAVLVYATQFVVTASLGVVFAYLADLQDRYGISDVGLGAIAATGFLAGLLTHLSLSPLVDRGYAKPLAWVSVAAAAIGAFGFVFAQSTWSLVASRAMAGVAFGLYALVARKALIGTDIRGSGSKVGGLLSCGVGGFVSGPFIGASLQQVAFEAPFVLTGSIMLVLGPLTALAISRVAMAIARVDYSHLAQLLRKRRMQAAICVHIGVWGLVGLFDATVDRYLTDIGLSTWEFALGLALIGIPLVVTPPHAGAMAERLGAQRVAIPALVVFAPAVIAYGWIGGFWSFLLIGLIESITESYSEMGSQVLVLEAAGAEQAAIGSGALEAVGLFTAGMAALLGPVVYGAHGPGWLFGCWGVFCGCLALATYWLLRKPEEITYSSMHTSMSA